MLYNVVQSCTMRMTTRRRCWDSLRFHFIRTIWRLSRRTYCSGWTRLPPGGLGYRTRRLPGTWWRPRPSKHSGQTFRPNRTCRSGCTRRPPGCCPSYRRTHHVDLWATVARTSSGSTTCSTQTRSGKFRSLRRWWSTCPRCCRRSWCSGSRSPRLGCCPGRPLPRGMGSESWRPWYPRFRSDVIVCPLDWKYWHCHRRRPWRSTDPDCWPLSRTASRTDLYRPRRRSDRSMLLSWRVCLCSRWRRRGHPESWPLLVVGSHPGQGSRRFCRFCRRFWACCSSRLWCRIRRRWGIRAPGGTRLHTDSGDLRGRSAASPPSRSTSDGWGSKACSENPWYTLTSSTNSLDTPELCRPRPMLGRLELLSGSSVEYPLIGRLLEILSVKIRSLTSFCILGSSSSMTVWILASMSL